MQSLAAKLSPPNDTTLISYIQQVLKTKVSASKVWTTMTLLVSLASDILTYLHSHTSHIFMMTATLSHTTIIYHLFHYALLQLKINEQVLFGFEITDKLAFRMHPKCDFNCIENIYIYMLKFVKFIGSTYNMYNVG